MVFQFEINSMVRRPSLIQNRLSQNIIFSMRAIHPQFQKIVTNKSHSIKGGPTAMIRKSRSTRRQQRFVTQAGKKEEGYHSA